MTTELRARLAKLWKRTGAAGNSDVYFDLLSECYKEPPRAYHTLTHVEWGLKRIDEIAMNEPHEHDELPAIEFAMWFHDAVMRFGEGADLDEEASAHLASNIANEVGLCAEFILQVKRLIRATDHQYEPMRIDEMILVDADLSILGANEEAFRDYERRVRSEWGHVSDLEFMAGRLKVLDRFASKRRIFSTQYASNKWEWMARSNIERSMAKLKSGAWP